MFPAIIKTSSTGPLALSQGYAYTVKKLLMHILETIKSRPVVSSLVALVVLGSAIGGYTAYQHVLKEKVACTSAEDALFEEAAGVVNGRDHDRQREFMRKLEETCGDYEQSPDYHYIATRYYIVRNDHEQARHHLERLKELDKPLRMDRHGRMRSVSQLDQLVSRLAEANRNYDHEEFGDTSIIEEPQ